MFALTFLAFVTLPFTLQKAPQLLEPFMDTESCLIKMEQYQKENNKQGDNKVFFCLKPVHPY